MARHPQNVMIRIPNFELERSQVQVINLHKTFQRRSSRAASNKERSKEAPCSGARQPQRVARQLPRHPQCASYPLISGLPAVSNHVLALAALLAKRLNEARSSRAIYASEQPMRLWGVMYIA